MIAGAALAAAQRAPSARSSTVDRWRQNIPAELQARPQWVVWSYAPARKSDKRPKVPYCPATGKAASVTDPATWASFDAAIDAWRRSSRYAGIGYVFAEADPYTGIDFDNCIEGGRLAPRVAAWLDEAGSYAERSPSGQGVKLIVRATLPSSGTRSQRLGLEVYDRARFFTFTGERCEGCPSTIAAAHSVAHAVYRAAGGGDSIGGPMTASAPAFTSDAAAAPSLQPGGPLRRADGTLRRPKADHWLNHYLRGDRGPYERLAAARGWDSGDSGLRYHGIDSLYAHGYPDEEIAALARAFLPQNQAGRDTARWWARELHSCLYGPKGAATRRPHIERSPSRGFVAPPLMVERDRGGRPQTVTADELLRYYHEESGKRELAGPRARDAEQLGISVPTLDRLDRQLRERGDISIESLPGRSGRRITLARCYQNLASEQPFEVPSEPTAPIAVEGVTAPENADLNPQCIGVSQGVAAEAPPTGVAPATTPLCSSPAEEPAGGALSDPGPLDAAGWQGLLGMSAPEPHELADPAAVAAWEVEGSLCPVPADCLPEAPVANGHEGVAGEAGDQQRPATYELPRPVTRKPEAVAFAHGASFDPAVGPLAPQHQASNWALLCEHWQYVAVPTSTGRVAQRVEQSPVSEGALAPPRTLATPAARVRGEGWLRAPPVHHRHALAPRRAGGGREQPVVHPCFDRALGPDQPDLKRGGPRDERPGPTPGAWCQGATSALGAAGGSPADRFPRQLDGGSC